VSILATHNAKTSCVTALANYRQIALDCRNLPSRDGKLPSRDQMIVYSFERCFRSSPFLSLALDPCL